MGTIDFFGRITGVSGASNGGISTGELSNALSDYVKKVGDTMTGDLILSASTNATLYIGCTDLPVVGSGVFTVFLGTSIDRVQLQIGQPVNFYTNVGLAIYCDGGIVARFGSSPTDRRANIFQDVLMNQHFIANLHDPNSAQDAATKNYVDSKLNNVGLLENLTGATANRNGSVVTTSGSYNASFAAWKIWDFTASPAPSGNEWANANLLTNYWVMIRTVNSLIPWKFQIAGRYNDPCQPNNWRIDASNDGSTFTTLHTSTVTLTSSVMEFQFSPALSIGYNYFRFYANTSSLTQGAPGLSYFQLF